MPRSPARNVTRADLAETVSRSSGLPRNDAADLVETFLGLINEALLRRENVMISGFGKFSVVERAARKGRNVKMGFDVLIEPRLAVVFKPAPGLVSTLNEGSAQKDAVRAQPDLRLAASA